MKQTAQNILETCAPWQHALAIQRQTVQSFYLHCAALLENSCPLSPLADSALSLKRNLFSTLFIMALEAAGVAKEKLPFYALINQCLRAQVTGCDNLLDDEYKSVIPFNLTGSGNRFRSVLTVMTADMVLGRMLAAEIAAGRMDERGGQCLLTAVLNVLIPSGIEEHEEESQTEVQVPTVQAMLEQVHYRKTGLLFEAPLRLATLMGETDPSSSAKVTQALAVFGIGCQILDDLQDVADDLYAGKYNIVISAAYHSTSSDSADESQLLHDYIGQQHSLEHALGVAAKLPVARATCMALVLNYFNQAEQLLHSCMAEFELRHSMALGMLVQESITAQRNDSSTRQPV
ncbi:MAG: class 1 isoprenoid biosynthesis enzyme [Desulfuromonas sp.]|nr:class 1 isoprenoid biosynthesis enzyme [Desulfuromonas sp.]